MDARIESARIHPGVVAAMIAAALAVTACALVAIAYMLGWGPARPSSVPTGPTSIAVPGQQVAGSAPDLALRPGESLVTSPEPPASAIPAPAPAPAPVSPAAPKNPAPAKPVTPVYAKTPPSSSTTYAQVLPSRAAPSKPNYTRDEVYAPQNSYERATRTVCVNCGVVASIRPGDTDWEVRVRFDDGSAETLRYPDPPRVRVGERVHLEDGRLVPD